MFAAIFRLFANVTSNWKILNYKTKKHITFAPTRNIFFGFSKSGVRAGWRRLLQILKKESLTSHYIHRHDYTKKLTKTICFFAAIFWFTRDSVTSILWLCRKYLLIIVNTREPPNIFGRPVFIGEGQCPDIWLISADYPNTVLNETPNQSLAKTHK